MHIEDAGCGILGAGQEQQDQIIFPAPRIRHLQLKDIRIVFGVEISICVAVVEL